MRTSGALDSLVNNAGSGQWTPVHETDANRDEIIDPHLDLLPRERVMFETAPSQARAA